MSQQTKKLSLWEKNKEFFSPLSSFIASLKILKLCAYYLLKKIPTFVWASLHLIPVIALTIVLMYFSKNTDPPTGMSIQEFEEAAAALFATSIYSFQLPFSVLFGIYVSTRIFKSMSQEGYDLILSSKPFYRQQVVATKILFLLLTISLYSLLMVLEDIILLGIWGLKDLKAGAFSFMAFSFFGNLVAGFLFAALAGLISTRFSENVSFLLTFLCYYGSSWVGSAIQPLTKLASGYNNAERIKKMVQHSQETNKSEFFYNNYSLNWKFDKPNNYSSLLYFKDQSQNGRGFDQEEKTFFEEINDWNVGLTSLTRLLGWTNIAFQISRISPVSQANFLDPTAGDAKFGESWSETNFSFINAHQRYENLIATGDITTSFVLKTITPESGGDKNLLTILDSKTKENLFLVPSVFITNSSANLNVKISPLNQEGQTQESQPSLSKNQRPTYGFVPIKWGFISIVMGTDKFHDFMNSFFEEEYFSKEEKEKGIKLRDSKNLTKGWFIKRLISRIERFAQETPGFTEKDKLLYFISGLYWSYLNFSNSRIAKVIASNNDQLTDFEPKSLEITIGENKYIIGGVNKSLEDDPKNNLLENPENNPEKNETQNENTTSLQNQQKNTLQNKDYFRANYLFGYTQNYAVFERWSDVVSKWAFASLWIFLMIIFVLGLMVILVRRDFK